jgi:hypothetical protein
MKALGRIVTARREVPVERLHAGSSGEPAEHVCKCGARLGGGTVIARLGEHIVACPNCDPRLELYRG